MKRVPIIAGVLVAALFLLVNAIFIVDERQQALKLQFGQIVGQEDGYRDPGLYFKIPLIQNVIFYEKRILPVETSELEIIPEDDRRLVVDAFARWRITDPLAFRRAVSNEAAALTRLEQILSDALRGVLGTVTSDDILSADRAALMTRIRDTARGRALSLGIDIIDVRIRRADLPVQNLQATFQRMQTEREREAADERARGEEAAQRVRANADRQATEIVSESQRDSDIIRGTADAERNRVFADAFGRDPEFFAFYRSLAAYENALRGDNSTLVISPDSEFFEFLEGDGGSRPSAPAE